MFDNICTLPLHADIFTLAIHPTSPIFSVGLSSGHVQTFRLPLPPGADGTTSSSAHNNTTSTSTSSHNSSTLIHKSPAITPTSRRLSENGFDTIDTVWQTRRHKGSCRALAFSHDGGILFSTGTDGLVKAAETETGRVEGKVVVPYDGNSTISRLDHPSVLHALTPQTLLLGTDTGRLHLFDLRTASPSTNSSSTASHATLPHSSRPSLTLRPHAPKDNPSSYTEPLTSLTPLPPSEASTSGTARMWVTTSGSTLAVCDLRKGVVGVSEDQGDELLSSAVVGGQVATEMAKKRRRNDISNRGATSGEKIIVGGARGILTLWDRGNWTDQTGRVVVHRGLTGPDDEGTVEALAVNPEGVVVAGLGTGEIKYVRLKGKGGSVAGSVRHDETGVDGVVALGFDVAGRMISGGGQVVKVWRRVDEAVGGAGGGEAARDGEVDVNGVDGVNGDVGGHHDEESDDDDDGDDELEAESDNEQDEEDDSDNDSDEPRARQKKKKKRGAKTRGGGNHGIAAFMGMD